MESKGWICECCETENPQPLVACKSCDEPRPKPKPSQKKDLKSQSNRNPIQLFSNSGGKIDLQKKTLNEVLNNFHPQKPIVIMVAAGLLGTGKSTWLSGLIYECEKDKFEVPGVFEVGHSQVTQTEGLWVYPYPLYLPGLEKSQIMLLDMEGTEGIKVGEKAEITKSSLIRLYTLGLMIASVFTIHTNFRLDNQTIETLKQSFMIVKQFQLEIPMEVPVMHILVKDCKEVKIGNVNKTPKEFIIESCEIPDDLAATLTISGRPKPSEKFLESLLENKNAFHELEKSDYSEFNKKFISQCLSKSKMLPLLNEHMNLENFARHIIELAGIINSESYQVLFKGSIEKMLASLIKPIKEDYLDVFKAKSNSLVSSFPAEKSLEEFQDEFRKVREQTIEEFKSELKKTIRGNTESLDLVKFEERQFNVMMKSNTAEQSFIMKKMEASSAKEKKALEEKIAKILEESKTQQKAIETIEKNYKNKIESYENQQEVNRRQHRETLERVQEEYKRNLALIAKKAKNEVEQAKEAEQKLKDEIERIQLALRQHGLVYRTKQQQQQEQEEQEKQKEILKILLGLGNY